MSDIFNKFPVRLSLSSAAKTTKKSDEFVDEENQGDFIVNQYPDPRTTSRRFSMPLMSSTTHAVPDVIMPSDSRLIDTSLLGRMMSDSHISSPGPRRRSSINFETFQQEETEALVVHRRTRRRASIHTSTMMYSQKHNEAETDELNLTPPLRRTPSKTTRRLSLDSVHTFWESTIGTDHQKNQVTKKVDEDKAKSVDSSSSTDDDNSSNEDSSDKNDTFNNDDVMVPPEEEWFPNNPHPLLEYPPLYFVLKRFPKLMTFLRSLYKVRWELSYPLQRRVPLSKLLRKVGICLTWGELLLWTPFAIILIQGMMSSFVNPSVSQSGIVARLPLAICFLTANHNSILTLLLGIPFERAIKYHKVSGYCAFINGIFHTYIAFMVDKEREEHNGGFSHFMGFSTEGQVNTSGTCLMLIILSMIITALPVVRRVVFEVFFYCHIAFAMAMVVCAFYHSGIFVVILASVLWGGDLMFRRIIMACRYPRTASIKRLTDTVIEISIKKTKNFDYNSGQYMFIAIPELSIFQWHPISISSSPYQNVVTFHIRKRGHWTSALYDLAGKKEEVTVYLEGPYGSLGVDLTSDRYKMAMFLSGGIGVTPMQSVCHQMLYENEWNERELKRIWFIWTARDPEVMENMDVVDRRRVPDTKILDSVPKESIGLPEVDVEGGLSRASSVLDRSIITERSLIEMPVSQTPDEELERELPLDDFLLDEEEEAEAAELEISQREGNNDFQSKNHHDIQIDEENQFQNSAILVAEDDSLVGASDSNSDEVLSLDCYLTAKEMKDAGITAMPFVHQGRPDMKKTFLMMREEAIKQGEKRVAVCVCAPKRLVQICKMACIKYSNSKVRFDFHSEVFD